MDIGTPTILLLISSAGLRTLITSPDFGYALSHIGYCLRNPSNGTIPFLLPSQGY